MAEKKDLQEQNVRPPSTAPMGNVFGSEASFSSAVRMANALAASTIVPKDYQNNTANCIIALEMASRLAISPMMVMQNLYVVNGRPAWSSQYIIAMINSSKKYKTELQFRFDGDGDNLGCRAWVQDYNDHEVVGPRISMQMAKDEGWLSKNGSKWKTMPEVMLRYRAASFFGRLNCPDMIMGIYSTDEVIEMDPSEYTVSEPEEIVKQEIAQNANKEIIDIPDEDIQVEDEPQEAEQEDKPVEEQQQEIAPPPYA